MRDSIDTTGFNSHEIAPLIPDPPIKSPRIRQRSNCCHTCWSRFTCCSKWSCLFITILVIVTTLIIVREVLPFGWPWWWPSIEYDPTDPHIIVIVADDIGWGDLGYGGAEFPTTRIDQLRQSGISLNRMYAHQEGSASRAALLTGIPGYALGLQNGIDVGSGAHIPTSAQLLPEILRSQRGYATHMTGKWALGYSKWAYTPTKRGFDTFVGFFQRYIDYWHYSATIEASSDREDADLTNSEMLMGYDLWKNRDVYTPSTKMQYATELFDEHIIDTIDAHLNGENPDQPMFLYYTPPNAHAPIQYHWQYDTECSYIKETSELLRWQYCNLMQELDASVGSLVDKLQSSGMWERSIVVFTSDNGGLMCYNVGSVNTCSGSVNSPLRGGKGTLFEGGLRVRSIVSGGAISDQLYGSSSDLLMHPTDLFSTLLSAANVDHSDIYYSDDIAGVGFWEYLSGEQEFGEEPTRDKPFIADMSFDPTGSYVQKAAVFWKGYKYIIQPKELYDGWWESPLGGISNVEIPSSSQAVEMQPNPIQGKGGRNNGVAAHSRGDLEDDDSEAVAWDELRMNEYLFLITDDAAETQNLRIVAEHQDTLEEMRTFLESLWVLCGDYEAQDSTTHRSANPNNFGNIWYPFEEEYR